MGGPREWQGPGSTSPGFRAGRAAARVPATAESGEGAAAAVGRGAGVETGPGEKPVGCGRPSHQEAGPCGRGPQPLQAPDGTEPSGHRKRLRGGNLYLCCSHSGVGGVGSVPADVALLRCYSLTTTRRNWRI